MQTTGTIVLIAILCGQSFSFKREKRSFSWPSFFGGGSADVAEVEQPQEEAPAQQQVEIPVQHLSGGYHYPIWRVHKYNGIELKPISLVQQQHLQQLHTQVPYTHLQQSPQFQPNQGLRTDVTHQPNQQNRQQFTNSQCKPKAAPAAIPPELQDLANQFGIKDASKLPSLEDAMGLLGTTSRAETIQTIKELAATPDGMNLVRQFLATDEGAAAGEDPNESNQCDEASATQQFIPQQPNNFNVPQRPNNFNLPHRQMSPTANFHQGYSIPMQNQQYGVPHIYPPAQHEVYGLPNAHQIVSFQEPPQSNIMSLIKNEAVPHEEYGVPNELSTAHSEHQGYNTPNLNIEQSQQGHQIYGLPNIKPAVAFQQEYYAPRSNRVESVKSEEIPHKEYNVPNEETNSQSETQEPHQEYGVPVEELNMGEQSVHETYGLPNVQEPANFLHQGPYPAKTDVVESEKSEAIVPHQEYGVPEQSVHETYGLPNVQEPVNFLQQGPYPAKTDIVESEKSEAIVPHQEYGVPSAQALPNTDNNNLKFIHPHQTYSIPEEDKNIVTPQETYGLANRNSDHEQRDQQDVPVSHQEYAIPSVAQTSNNAQSHAPHESYALPALPHQRFFESPNVFRQSQYGAPTKFNSNNHLTRVPISSQIGGILDRTHTNLQLGQLLTTTPRPEAGFLERVAGWTGYFAPPGPTIPIVPPQVTEDVNESFGHSPNAYTIPIPKIPEINGPQLHGLPTDPQLPNIYIPQKFILPATANQGPFVRVQKPLSDFDSQYSQYELPHQQPEPFDGQTVEEFVPDVSQLPLDQINLGNDLRTSYGIPTYQYSYAADSSPAASETNEQHVAVALPNRSGKSGNQIDNEEIIENEVVDEQPQKKYGPQRISSYDSYATGKLNRANDDAIIQLIPTQKPSLYSNQGRRIRQVEESSIIDAIATMTSGFRPIV